MVYGATFASISNLPLFGITEIGLFFCTANGSSVISVSFTVSVFVDWSSLFLKVFSTVVAFAFSKLWVITISLLPVNISWLNLSLIYTKSDVTKESLLLKLL